MGLKIGIVGLPNAGKSTVFNALSKGRAHVANYPFTTIEPNAGVAVVPDERLNRLADIYKPGKATPTTIEFVDVAGLVKGASSGEGLGNQFLGHIKEVDAVLHVVRCFDDSNVVHVSGTIDPKRDIGIVDAELCLKDLDAVEARRRKLEKAAKSNDPDVRTGLGVCEKAAKLLERGIPVRKEVWSKEEAPHLAALKLLTQKPVLYCANVNESELPRGSRHADRIREMAERDGSRLVVICGKVEAEVSELSIEEGQLYLKEFGLEESGLHQLIHLSYELLDLVTFLTVNENEVRAWTIRKGTKAPQAAGVVHTDFERGFIRAEVMRFDDLARYGNPQAVKEKGLYRLEGREYVVQDGDVIYFRSG